MVYTVYSYPEPNTSYLVYCNAYLDLQIAYCSSGTCSTDAHDASCKSHWETTGFYETWRTSSLPYPTEVEAFLSQGGTMAAPTLTVQSLDSTLKWFLAPSNEDYYYSVMVKA